MRLALTERFQSDVRALSSDERAAVFEVLLALPRALGHPHVHAGLGLRKIHPSGIWETRAGLAMRVVFLVKDDVATLVRAGTHDAIRRYLGSL